MSENTMNSKVQELRELRRMADELAGMIEALTDEIKAEMTTRSTDSLSGGDWKITWKPVTSSRLDTTALKNALPDIAAAYTKSTTVRRFVLA